MRLHGAIPPPAGACIRAFSAFLCLCLPAAQADLAKPRGSYAVETSASVPAGGETLIELRILDFRKKPAFGRLPEFEFEVDRPPLSGVLANWRQMPRVGDSDRATVIYRHDPASPSDSDSFTFRAVPSGGGEAVGGTVAIKILRPLLEAATQSTSLGTGYVGETLRATVILRNLGAATTKAALTISPPFRLGGPATFSMAPAASIAVPVEVVVPRPGRVNGALTVAPSGFSHPLTVTGQEPVLLSTAKMEWSQAQGQTLPAVCLWLTNAGRTPYPVTLRASAPFQLETNLVLLSPGASFPVGVSLVPGHGPGAVTGVVNVASEFGQWCIPVSVHVSPPPQLALSPSALNFILSAGSSPMPPQAVQVTNLGASAWRGHLAISEPFTVTPRFLNLAPGAVTSVAISVTLPPSKNTTNQLEFAGPTVTSIQVAAGNKTPPQESVIQDFDRDSALPTAAQTADDPPSAPNSNSERKPRRSLFILVSPAAPDLAGAWNQAVSGGHVSATFESSADLMTYKPRLVRWTPLQITPTGVLAEWRAEPNVPIPLASNSLSVLLDIPQPGCEDHYAVELLSNGIPIARTPPLDLYGPQPANRNAPFLAVGALCFLGLLAALLRHRRRPSTVHRPSGSTRSRWSLE